MSSRRGLEERRARLAEVREILAGMKSLAYLQVHRLSRLVEPQREVVAAIDAAAAGLLAWHPYTLPRAGAGPTVVVAVGSERGFVGDFNERLARRVETTLSGAGAEVTVIAVGRRLASRLQGHPRLKGAVEGASVPEEVTSAVRRVVAEIDRLQGRAGGSSLAVVSLGAAGESVREECLLPPFEAHVGRVPAEPFPPLLYLPPQRLLVDLSEHFVLAALQAIVTEALLAENQRRVRHLEAAVRHVDDRLGALDRHLRLLRQEEIIEEIEVILLSASGLPPHRDERGPAGGRQDGGGLPDADHGRQALKT